MEYSQFAVLVLLMMTRSIHARSLDPNDVPGPPNNPSSGFLHKKTIPHLQAHLAVEDNETPMLDNQVKTKISSDIIGSVDVELLHIPIVKLPVGILSQSMVMKSHSNNEHNHSGILNDEHKNIFVKSSLTSKDIRGDFTLPGSLKGNEIAFANAGNGTESPTTVPVVTTKLPITTTTLDSWDQFCQEACEEGLAGHECDCAEHPIG